MAIDAWLPVGFQVPTGETVRRAVHAGDEWQIFATPAKGSVLVATETLADRWRALGLLSSPRHLRPFEFSGARYEQLSSGGDHVLAPLSDCRSPDSKDAALAFAAALEATRAIDGESPLHDAIYVERFSRLLPTFSLTPRVADDVLLGTWLTGGFPVSVVSRRRLRSLMGWLSSEQLDDVLARAGFVADTPGNVRTRSHMPADAQGAPDEQTSSSRLTEPGSTFSLPGRPSLEAFFNEHVVDIVQNQERYATLGIPFPSSVILHGPPGCGKTFAVERLVDFLGWPSYTIDASSIASPYIHETSRKVAEIFDQAMKHSPAVIVIDEMEAFLSNRQSGSGSSHHQVEEIAEFLRRIPEASGNEVLVIAMTNRIEMIDPAILRRGRFDHVIEVGMASAEEVEAMLTKLLSELPCENDVDARLLARPLSDRPLSDVAFAVREAARLSARAGHHKIGQAALEQAIQLASPRHGGDPPRQKVGFI